LDIDLDKDLIHVSYDPGQLTPERIVEVVREQRFQATIVPGPTGAGQSQGK
jgi:hypothetical protein